MTALGPEDDDVARVFGLPNKVARPETGVAIRGDGGLSISMAGVVKLAGGMGGGVKAPKNEALGVSGPRSGVFIPGDRGFTEGKVVAGASNAGAVTQGDGVAGIIDPGSPPNGAGGEVADVAIAPGLVKEANGDGEKAVDIE